MIGVETTVIRKVSSTDSEMWRTAIGFRPVLKSLSVSLSEQNVYFAKLDSLLDVICLNSSDGSISSMQTLQGITGNSEDIRIHVKSDNSGYFIFALCPSSISCICKYLFSTPTIIDCYIISLSDGRSYGQLMLSDTEFFILCIGTTTPAPLNLHKLTFGRSSTDWTNKMSCQTMDCALHLSESLRSKDKSKIYSFFISGVSQNLYFITLSSSSGEVLGSRYRSSSTLQNVYGSALNGDYILITFKDSSVSYLIMFNTIIGKYWINFFNKTITKCILIESFK